MIPSLPDERASGDVQEELVIDPNCDAGLDDATHAAMENGREDAAGKVANRGCDLMFD